MRDAEKGPGFLYTRHSHYDAARRIQFNSFDISYEERRVRETHEQRIYEFDRIASMVGGQPLRAPRGFRRFLHEPRFRPFGPDPPRSPASLLIGRFPLSLPDFDPAIAFLGRPGTFLVTSHVNGDGDSIGRLPGHEQGPVPGMGKSATIVLPDVPGRFGFLPGFGDIQQADGQEGIRPDAAVILDCPSLDRIGSVVNFLGDTAVLNIDHHRGKPAFRRCQPGIRRRSARRASCSSTCAQRWTPTVDASLAEQLYTGILFDTGSFRYSLTTRPQP